MRNPDNPFDDTPTPAVPAKKKSRPRKVVDGVETSRRSRKERADKERRKRPRTVAGKIAKALKSEVGCKPGQATMDAKQFGAPGGRIGQAPFVPTDEQRQTVLEMVAVGLAQKQIAKLIKNKDGTPIGTSTLVRHFREELDNGSLRAIANVGGALYRGAMCGNPALIRMYWNTHAHRHGLPTEKQRHEHSGPNGGPISMMDWSELIEATPANARPALMQAIEKMIADAGEADDAAASDEDI